MATDPKLTRVVGRAKLAKIREKTGSEHTGIFLETAAGERIVLVRLRANPFDDEETRKLDGRTVEVEGYRVGNELRFVSARDVIESA